MTQSKYPDPKDATVSIIPKTIKIYSDNPIHEAIDRIIDSCNRIDEGDDSTGIASVELREAAEDLIVLSTQNLYELQRKWKRDFNAKKANQN